MGQIRLYRKDLGITYVYESKSYWDKVEKKHKSKRKLIGKLDPVTGEIIPTRSCNREAKSSRDSAASASETGKEGSLKEELEKSQQQICDLRTENSRLQEENSALRKELGRYQDLAEQARTVLAEIAKSGSAS